MDIKKELRDIREIVDELIEMLKPYQRGYIKCTQSIDYECADCVEDCSQESYSSGTHADLDKSTAGYKNVEFMVIMESPSNSAVIESVEALDEVFLDEFFMETDCMDNTYKVSDTMTEINVKDVFGIGYTNSDFDTFDDMYVAEFFMDPAETGLNLPISDLTRDIKLLLNVVPTSCLVIACSSYSAYERKNDISMIIFDPGGIVWEVNESQRVNDLCLCLCLCCGDCEFSLGYTCDGNWNYMMAKENDKTHRGAQLYNGNSIMQLLIQWHDLTRRLFRQGDLILIHLSR